MRLATGFALGVLTAATVVELAILSGYVDARLEQARKDRRRVVELQRQRRRHVRRAPARWPA